VHLIVVVVVMGDELSGEEAGSGRSGIGGEERGRGGVEREAGLTGGREEAAAGAAAAVGAAVGEGPRARAAAPTKATATATAT